MSASANQIALAVVRSILDAAHPVTLTVAGTEIAVAVSRDTPAPWPASGFPGVAPEAALPASVRAECSWKGGAVTLSVEVTRENLSKYDGDVCLTIYTGSRCLLWCNLRAAIERAAGEPTAEVTALVALVKRGAAAAEQPEINKALRAVVAASGLPLATKSKVQLAEVRLPDGAIEGGAAAAFARALLLALIKIDFVARRSAAKRGAPIVDFAKLGLSDAAIATLTRANLDVEDGDDSGEDEPDDEAEPVARIRRRAQRAVPDEGDRRAALELLAYAIENAHDERPDGWYMRTKSNELALFTGRIAACSLWRGTISLSVMGPISPEIRAALSADVRENEAWRAIPGGLFLRFPAAKATVALELLKDPFDRFVDETMARLHRQIDPDIHVAEAVTFVADAVGRSLPQPELGGAQPTESDDDDGSEEEIAASREPVKRGRAPIFDKGHRSIVSLLSDVEQGRIALPDLQRPFVWEDTKVRDLLDSLFLGYPAGTVMLWRTDDPRDARTLGSDAQALQASSLVIDGQQRLTSLYAVFKGVEVLDKDGRRRPIKIAFRPRDGRFDVPDAAIQQDPEYLPDVSELWRGKRGRREIRMTMLAALKAKGREVDGSYEEAIEHNLERLDAIDKFEFPVVEIRKDEPDMIVHQPGSMSGNLCALEIKPANAALARMRKDIQTLNAFVKGADYTFAILLIYGDPDMLSQTDLEDLSALCGDNTEVWWHPGAGRSAKPVAGTMETAAAARVAPQRAQGSAVALRRHVPYWSPDPYAPLDDPRWEEQVLPQVRARVRALLARHAAGEIDWADFTEDRKSADGGWGLRMCLWSQHHKNDQRHKNLGRPFWSVEAFRNWVANIESLPPAEVRDRRGAYTQRTIEKFNGTKLGAFLRHEHVVPKKVMIDWLVREPGRVDEILAKNVCCVITRAEDSRLARDTHPDPANPWRRYEGTGIRLLFNPDWSDEVVAELTRHGLLTHESYEPMGLDTPRYRLAR